MKRSGNENGPTKPPAPPLEIDTHEALARQRREVVRRLSADPELGRLLFVNPALAFRDAGVRLSPELSDHVLRAVRRPPRVQARIDELERQLTEKLGEAPATDDPEWIAHALFDLLKLQPLDTTDQQPVFRGILSDETLNRLSKLKPKLRPRPEGARRIRGTAVQLKPWQPRFRLLDYTAPVPELKPARKRPKSVPLEQLFFYKDRDAAAHDLLELGVRRRGAFPIQSADSYRKIRRGERRNAFYSWIERVEFKARRRAR